MLLRLLPVPVPAHPMYTQCPECQTIYEIDEDALQASLGIVHCGHCQKRFDALRTLSDTLPLAPEEPLPEHDPASRAPMLTAAVPPAAFATALRKRHQRDDPRAPVDAAAPDPEPPTPAGPPPEPRANSDDWFADLESEFTTAAADRPPEATATADAGADIPWAIDAPDAADAVWPEAAPSLPDEAAPEAAADVPEDDEPPAAVAPDTPLDVAENMSAEVVSPYLLEGDSWGAATAAEPASSEVAVDPADVPCNETAPEPADEPDTAVITEPVYVRPHPRLASTTTLAWALGCLVLVLLLAAQLAWAHRVELLRNPSTHPWVARVCRTLPCRLPPIRDIAKLELLSRDVRPDPNARGALMITATVRNDAAFRQPWPVVVVRLTNIDDRTVAMRRFRPAEYLPNPARRAAGIAPGETAALAFEVADPGRQASGFQFAFE